MNRQLKFLKIDISCCSDRLQEAEYEMPFQVGILLNN